MRSGWFGRYKLSALGGIISASVNSRSCKTINQNWLGQNWVVAINVPVALSGITFCNTFPMHENGGKHQKDKLCHGTQNPLITSAFGSGR